MYKFKQFGDRYVISVDNHQEIAAALQDFCEKQGVKLGLAIGIGAVREATLRFFNPATKKYVDRTFKEQMEIANLTGNVSEKDGKVYLHLHATFGRADYTTIGGHLMTATVNGACEIEVQKLDGHIGRVLSEEIGLNVYDM